MPPAVKSSLKLRMSLPPAFPASVPVNAPPAPKTNTLVPVPPLMLATLSTVRNRVGVPPLSVAISTLFGPTTLTIKGTPKADRSSTLAPWPAVTASTPVREIVRTPPPDLATSMVPAPLVALGLTVMAAAMPLRSTVSLPSPPCRLMAPVAVSLSGCRVKVSSPPNPLTVKASVTGAPTLGAPDRLAVVPEITNASLPAVPITVAATSKPS